MCQGQGVQPVAGVWVWVCRGEFVLLEAGVWVWMCPGEGVAVGAYLLIGGISSVQPS